MYENEEGKQTKDLNNYNAVENGGAPISEDKISPSFCNKYYIFLETARQCLEKFILRFS